MIRNIMLVTPNIELIKNLNRLLGNPDINILWEPDHEKIIRHFKIDTFDLLLISSQVLARFPTETLEVIETLSTKCTVTKIIILVEPDDLQHITNNIDPDTCHLINLPISDAKLKLLITQFSKQRHQIGINLLLETQHGGESFQNIIGRSEPMKRVFRKIRQAASSDIPILLLGETGTGKDLVAQAIHRESVRKAGPFFPINLGAIPKELIGSELFGHEKGAFTGALNKQSGCFERADGGSIFLDEIGIIDEKLQISLLRVIEQKQFHRLGGHSNISVDVRLIAATNEDLPEKIQRGLFREDLYYRLDVFRISLPPLRERTGDISLLSKTFLDQFNTQFGKNIQNFHADTIHVLETYEWPGNVRELKNIIQRAVLVCDKKYIEPGHLPLGPIQNTPSDITFTVGTTISQVERKMLIYTLKAVHNNRKKAAELLGISRRTLYNKLKKFNIKQNDPEIR